MSGTKILKCDCIHEYQDKLYGKGMRVHTSGNPQSTRPKFTCTVCTKIK